MHGESVIAECRDTSVFNEEVKDFNEDVVF